MQSDGCEFDPDPASKERATRPSRSSWDCAIVGITVEEPHEAVPGFGDSMGTANMTHAEFLHAPYLSTLGIQYDARSFSQEPSPTQIPHPADYEHLPNPHTPSHRTRSFTSTRPTFEFDPRPRANSDNTESRRPRFALPHSLQGSAIEDDDPFLGHSALATLNSSYSHYNPLSVRHFHQLQIPAPVGQNPDLLSPYTCNAIYDYPQSYRGSDTSSIRSLSPGPGLDWDQSSVGSDFDDPEGSFCGHDSSYDMARPVSSLAGHLDQVHLTQGHGYEEEILGAALPFHSEEMSTEYAPEDSRGLPTRLLGDSGSSKLFTGDGFMAGFGPSSRDDEHSQVVEGLAPVPAGKAIVTTVAGRTAAKARRRDKTKPGAFKCDRCGADLTAKHNLKNHLRSHDGVKDYFCDHCGHGFGTTHVRKRHMLSCPKRPYPRLTTLQKPPKKRTASRDV